MSIDKNIRAYDKKAGNYDDTLDGKFTGKFKDLLLANMAIKDNDAVLDVGCGNGTLLSKIDKAINGFGVDVSPQMIKNASVRHPEFEFIVSGCEKIPISDNSMDIITVCAAYHHFPDVSAFADEAERLIKQGGNLYIAEVYLPLIIRHAANIFLPFSKDGDVKFYSCREIADAFSGFSLVKTVRKGYIQIIQMQRK
jgi:ubiquinone/menaquinone biosynthesis C-methylase UbiE